MIIHRTILAAAFATAAISAAGADELRPIEGRSVDLGAVSGAAYYTVERDGHRVVRSLAEGQHNFILGAGRVPEVDRAIEEIGQWLRSKLGLAVLAAA